MPELGGTRPDRLSAVSGPQERVPRRIVEQIVDSAPVVPLLHDPDPVLQMVDSVEEVRRFFLQRWLVAAEQTWDCEDELDFEMPKILQHMASSRSSLLEPQTAEQLVEVPGFEFVFVRRAEGALCLGVVRVAGHTFLMRVHDTGWSDTAGQGGIQILGTIDGVDVSVTMHDKFPQSPINSGWCFSSVHRRNVGHSDEQYTDKEIDVPVMLQNNFLAVQQPRQSTKNIGGASGSVYRHS